MSRGAAGMNDRQLRQAEGTLHNAATRLVHAAALVPEGRAGRLLDAAEAAREERDRLSQERRRRENARLDDFA